MRVQVPDLQQDSHLKKVYKSYALYSGVSQRLAASGTV